MTEKEKMINEFWEEFLLKTNRDSNINYIDCFHFESTEKWANELLRLVIIGQKKATSSNLIAYDITDDIVPKVGDLSIVTDWYGNPKCVIETTDVMIIPFNEITFDICKREGEDENLESWRKKHVDFFTSEGKELGFDFSEDMPIVFEDFKMIFNI